MLPVLRGPSTRVTAALYGGLILILASCNSDAETYQSEDYDLKVETVAEGLTNPWGLAFLPDGRMLVSERPGRLRIVEDDGRLSPPLDGLPPIFASGQGGLLDVILDPEVEQNAVIYLSYAEPGPGGAGTAVARAVLDREGNRISDVEVIFRQAPKTNTGIHFGSRLVFDRAGKLFITIGERGERDRAQDFTINRGQVIRINRDGSIPEDNPFVGREGYRPEVWSYGHRNPQGAALHPDTGEFWEVEHGAQGGDEINIPEAGRNYGWPVISYGRHYSGQKIGVGTHKDGMEQPVHYWDPSIAPSGMMFYTGDKFPAWKGNLFIGALKFRLVSRLVLDGDTVVAEERILGGLQERIRDVRQGPDGYIYLLTDSGDGRILRVTPAD
ncbi:MAG: PQQ-dependent sugar dehydrogenase [Alphaproteobacteria bacterium]|nr:PQQ-dependent sugar dehydrogenase [Alphaproteobacteria bacterium]